MGETLKPQDLHATDEPVEIKGDLHATSEPASLGLHAVPKAKTEAKTEAPAADDADGTDATDGLVDGQQVEEKDLHATSEPFKPTR